MCREERGWGELVALGTAPHQPQARPERATPDPKPAWPGRMLTPTLLAGPRAQAGGLLLPASPLPHPVPQPPQRREREQVAFSLTAWTPPTPPRTSGRPWPRSWRGLLAPKSTFQLSQARHPHSCLLSNQTARPGCWKASLEPNTETPRLSASQGYRGVRPWQSGHCPKTGALAVQGWGIPEEGCPLPGDPP